MLNQKITIKGDFDELKNKPYVVRARVGITKGQTIIKGFNPIEQLTITNSETGEQATVKVDFQPDYYYLNEADEKKRLKNKKRKEKRRKQQAKAEETNKEVEEVEGQVKSYCYL
jgi:ribosomal protein S1